MVELGNKYSRGAAGTVGAEHVAGAPLTQFLVLVGGAILYGKRSRLFRQKQGSWILDKFRNLGLVIILLLVAARLSIDLLQVGIVCPNEGIPDSRGKPLCEYTRARIIR